MHILVIDADPVVCQLYKETLAALGHETHALGRASQALELCRLALAERFPVAGDDPGIGAGRLHSFRHYFCSIAADNGVSEQMLMAWLGHRNSAMVKHYYHLRQDESRRGRRTEETGGAAAWRERPDTGTRRDGRIRQSSNTNKDKGLRYIGMGQSDRVHV
jgi:hypothetical protein